MLDGISKKSRRKTIDHTRQYGESIDRIKIDHVKRYLFAATYLSKFRPGSKVLDIACGCGYGSWLLHGSGLKVTGVDISSEAISYAERHYQGPTYLCQDAKDTKGEWDAICSFETLEHLDSPKDLLLAVKAPLLIASVPNEDKYPFNVEKFGGDDYPHKRHYTPSQFDELLENCGYRVTGRLCQENKVPGDVIEGTNGVFLIYVAKK